MCGIFCAFSNNRHVLPSDKLAARLQSRGPDSQAGVHLTCSASSVTEGEGASRDVFVTLYSTVLSLRGDSTVQQPYQDASKNYTLCWNGEAWSVAGEPVKGNDTEIIHGLLVDAMQASSKDASMRAKTIAQVLSTVAGPYAFLFLDHARRILFCGRDFLGRRSLLTTTTAAGDVLISSVSGGNHDLGWTELEARGIYSIDFGNADLVHSSPGSLPHAFSGCEVAPYHYSSSSTALSGALTGSVIPHLSLGINIPDSQVRLGQQSQSVAQLETFLRDALAVRATNIPRPPLGIDSATDENTARLAVLFSGGLDCTTLARISHDLLPVSEPIDLLNVAFENPRINRTRSKDESSGLNIYELCPDRLTGRASHSELQQVCPGRTWRFVSINVSYAEFGSHRENIVSLMHPHNTEMDLSIASALYFAARGQGKTSESSSSPQIPYTLHARVLLSGLGADEVFGGYTRHATAFKRYGFSGLLEEMQLDIGRLGKRNLGRDDRVMSHWGKEVRYPYLDERLLSWALNTSVVAKCGFGEPENVTSVGDESTALEPGKKALRCLAWKLGMKNVAREKKRAIQFGARTAKMETGKTKGTQLLD